MGCGLRTADCGQRLALVLIMACTTAHPPQAPKEPTGITELVKADVQRAEDAELARKHDVARSEYERAVADATNAESRHFAHREYAETLETWGELDGATAHLEAAVAAAPGDALAWQHLGLLYHHAGDDRRARAALERSKQLAPKSYYPRKALAALDLCANDRESAMAEYRDMLALDLPERMRADVQQAIDYLAKSPGPFACGPRAP